MKKKIPARATGVRRNTELTTAPRIRHLRGQGYSVRQIVRTLKEDGFPITDTTVCNILRKEEDTRRAMFLEEVRADASALARKAVEAHVEILELGVPLLRLVRDEMYFTDKEGSQRFSPKAATAWAQVANSVQRAAAELAGFSGKMNTNKSMNDSKTMVLQVFEAYGHEAPAELK